MPAPITGSISSPGTSVSTTRTSSARGRQLAFAGAAAVVQKTEGHRAAIQRTGVGTHFGDHSPFKSFSPADRADWIAENAKPGTQPGMPKESSCIGWALENVGAAYKAAGMSARWSQIVSWVAANGSRGIILAEELVKDGWQVVYFNPDAKTPADGSSEHSYSAAVAQRQRKYYGLPVTDTVMNYRPSSGSATTRDLRGIEKLKQAPFFFGLARGGVHTFVGREGKVNEFHWSAMPDDPNAIEERPLENFPWLSGAVVVPPGTWPR